MRLTQIIEALLFASDAPLSAGDLARVDERLDEDTVEAVIQELRSDYDLSERSFQIYEVAGGFQILTRPEFVAVLDRYETVPQTTRLSGSALEVLAVIAYRQPIGRSEVEEIRGVGSSGVIKTLLDRELIHVVGRSDGLGRPLLYGTTDRFLEHFGFRSIEDMPRPDELPVVLRERTIPSEPEVESDGQTEGGPGAATNDAAARETAGEGQAAAAAEEGVTEPSVNPLADEEVAALLTEAEEELAEEMAESIAGQVETDASIAEEPPVLDETGAVIDVSVEVPMPDVAESEDAGNEPDAAAIEGDSSTDDGPAAEDDLAIEDNLAADDDEFAADGDSVDEDAAADDDVAVEDEDLTAGDDLQTQPVSGQ